MTSARTAPVRRVQTPRPSPSTGGWLAMIVLLFLAGIGAIGGDRGRRRVPGASPRACRRRATSTTITPIEESIIYDRTGKIELARFGDERREVVTYEEIPPILLDATTAIEDKTFWDNAGFDPLAIISAGLDSLRGNSRGASTITQQLVRARLLPDDLVQDPNRTVERKLKEIIQSIRVTQAFSGEDGKQKIITAYLNQNYYGNQSYGVKAAVESYFGKPLEEHHAGRGGDHRRPAEVARRTTTSSATRSSSARRPSPRTRSAPKTDLDRPGRHDDRPAAQPGARPARRGPDAEVRRHVHAPRSSGPPRATRCSSPARSRPIGWRRTSCGPSATS